MKTLRRPSLLKNKKLLVFLAVVLLIICAVSYSLTQTKQAASPSDDSTQVTKATTAQPAPAASQPVATTPPPTNQTDPTPQVQPVSGYPLHTNITATVFWVGEGADDSNDYIHNRASAWMTDWVSAYGGIDSQENRCGYRPCAFTPKENPFYFALPFNDYDENGLKSDKELHRIPWYTGTIPENTSILKNRWIEVTHGNRTAYGQWEDVGPFGENDAAYVFGSARPLEPRAGLDLSPALADYLGVDGRGIVSWRFIDSSKVPKGEWTKIVTQSNLHFE
jgi:hypothetical protein